MAFITPAWEQLQCILQFGLLLQIRTQAFALACFGTDYMTCRAIKRNSHVASKQKIVESLSKLVVEVSRRFIRRSFSHRIIVEYQFTHSRVQCFAWATWYVQPVFRHGSLPFRGCISHESLDCVHFYCFMWNASNLQYYALFRSFGSSRLICFISNWLLRGLQAT